MNRCRNSLRCDSNQGGSNFSVKLITKLRLSEVVFCKFYWFHLKWRRVWYGVSGWKREGRARKWAVEPRDAANTPPSRDLLPDPLGLLPYIADPEWMHLILAQVTENRSKTVWFHSPISSSVLFLRFFNLFMCTGSIRTESV